MKRIVICADGTWNTADQSDPTNVLKMSKALDACKTSPDGLRQITHYHDGVGAKASFFDKILNAIRGVFSRGKSSGNLWQGITGEGLDRIIRDCYETIRKDYEDGDEIFVFGFSRGAYTVRSLAGFIRKCGVLKSDSTKSVVDAYNFYRNGVKPTEPAAIAFRKDNSFEANVFFIGVWDTVGSLGIPLGGDVGKFINADRQFHDVTLSSHVKYAFHAVAIDELRKPFRPTLWEQQAGADQQLEQAWFVGVHSNVGGGYPDHGLCDLTWRWMAERAKTAGLGFDENYVEQNVGAGKWEGRIYDSFAAPYDLLGPYPRPIAARRVDDKGNVIDTREYVHDSAQTRFGRVVPPETKRYAPAKLAEYLKQRRPGLAPVAVPAPMAARPPET